MRNLYDRHRLERQRQEKDHISIVSGTFTARRLRIHKIEELRPAGCTSPTTQAFETSQEPCSGFRLFLDLHGQILLQTPALTLLQHSVLRYAPSAVQV